MKLSPLEWMETYTVKTETHTVALCDYASGIHSTPHAFFKKDADGSVPWVISRVCDHAGGQLRVSDSDACKAVCPLHNWEFDFNSLSYSKIPNQTFNYISKKSLPFSVKGETLSYDIEQHGLRVPTSIVRNASERTDAELRFVCHASVMLTVDGVNLLTDPWFVGECLATGWWLKQPPKADAWELLARANLLYISHNHPDHLHAETLARARRDIPIIVPKFDTDSTAAPLRAMGFTNVIELEQKRLYRVNDSDLLVSVLPTGDHRDDSGLFLTQGDFSAVLTVDCVGANHYILPQNPTLLLTNFSSGASGWPLCYDVVGSLETRSKIVTKNRGNAQREVMKYIHTTQPKVYMPYAGFFDEKAPRDRVIQDYNIKNGPQVITEKVRAKFPDILAVNPMEHDLVTWKDGKANCATVNQPPLFHYDDATITQCLKKQRALLNHFDIHHVADYFCQSEFQDQLIVYLVLTDDAYVPENQGLCIDFSKTPIHYTVVESASLLDTFTALAELGDYHHLLIKVRSDSLWHIVYYGRPLEELTLGFQCRIDRKPDQYNAAFWKHYTTYGAPMLRRGEDRLLYKLLEGAGG